MPKIKNENKKIQTPCIKCFEPIYLKFNFSYLSVESDLTDKYKAQIFERMHFLSKNTFLVISGYDKKLSFEQIPQNKLRLKKQIPSEFAKRFPDLASNHKIAIMRLYTNDNPILGRLIGMINKNIFYVFFIDIDGKLYSH